MRVPLIVELRHAGQWDRVGAPLRAGTADGSMSHNGPAGRQIYRFGCRGDHSVLERSRAGADGELAAGALRATISTGFELVARLDAEHPSFECWLKTDRSPQPMRVRFSHEP